MASTADIYSTDVRPVDHIASIRESDSQPPILKSPNYGIDSPVGLASSLIFAPLYLYATKKGKSDVWDGLLADLPDDTFDSPTLDAGCGRGLVLLKHAQRKQHLGHSTPCVGIDIFSTADQSGNAPEATFANVASLGLLEHVVLHTASFTSTLPFKDDQFSLVTSSLAIHNVPEEGRRKAILELARITKPSGRIVILDLLPYPNEYAKVLKNECGWQDVERKFGGISVMFGVWPCGVMVARKPASKSP